MTRVVSHRSGTTAGELQWIKSLIERERALLGAMLVHLHSVSRALAEPNDPSSANGHVVEAAERIMVEAFVGRLRADDERLGALAEQVAQTENGRPV